uniref:DM domain-containing protein n=1 Tax=Haemonchus contortus TaxID=6289 RepID=A0A912MSC0_HAECO
MTRHGRSMADGSSSSSADHRRRRRRRRRRHLRPIVGNEGSRRSSFSSCTDSPGTSNCSMDGEPVNRKQSTSSRTGLEGRSMSLGAMTVMSYDIWKAKCAAEKKRLEAEGKANGGDGTTKAEVEEQQLSSSPPARKRAHTFVARDEPREIPKVSPPNSKEKKGRYILLPTIPAMKVFVGEDAPAIVPPEPSNILAPDTSTSVPTTTAPLSLPTFSAAPTLPIPAPLPRPSPIAVTAPNFFPSLSGVTPPVAPATTTTAFGAGFTADQLLATLLPSSVLLQNAGLLQQNALASLLGLATTPVVPPPATSCANDVLALLRAQQSAQLAAALAAVPGKNTLLPSSTSPDDLIQTLLAQTRQPIFSHSL